MAKGILYFMPLNGTIMEAKFKQHPGGVARNIAEALTKLGCPPIFISVVGDDSYGHNICSLLPEGCIKYIYKLPNHNTAQCNVVFDNHGECKILIGDMDIHAQITPDMIKKHEYEIKKCPLLVLDGNLTLDALETALKLAQQHDIPVDASITLKPDDVPGALLSPNLSIEDHTKLQLQRWLACRCLKQGGTKSDLVQRVTNCIKAGTDNNIFLGIDGGKWYDAKRRLIPIASTSSAVIIEDFKSIKWTKFPAQLIAHYFNKGHIYTYIVGTHFETEDYEAGEITGVTEKPFRRGTHNLALMCW
ncbi:hypothetical protein RN001_008671 [Aquatica leii]|uniref:Carbohydrate kinase PfkB domain-containing protein n=1 Tax=Aquatica leii TaxID=1421715 RepID=A0AAN7P4J7_9COLE|nr:hypothetical protein RN001_008671 [Aquatica leii]